MIGRLLSSYNPRCNRAKKKRVKKPVNYSLAQLQQLVASKQSELDDLKAKRDELQKQLNQLDQQISQAEGNGRAIATPVATKTRATKEKRVAVKKRAKNERTAKDWAIEILEQEKKGLPLKDLANRMLESGYKTTSTNFSMALYQVLHNARNKGETLMWMRKRGSGC